MKVVIIDDEPLARSIVKEYLDSFPEIEIVDECNDGFEGVKAIQQHKPDLVFLDIQMPKITGFEMLELLEEQPSVIFTTAFDEYAMKAFEAHAVDYLLKPFSKERFAKAMEKWRTQSKSAGSEMVHRLLDDTASQFEGQTNRIVVKVGNAIKIIPIRDILYIEAYGDYVKIHTKEGFFLKKKTMSFFEHSLDVSNFARAHRSYLINIQELNKIEQREKDSHIAILKNGTVVPLSKTGYARIKELLKI
ncbi:MAG: response regulator [Cyclobacteriaceae bacterium]